MLRNRCKITKGFKMQNTSLFQNSSYSQIVKFEIRYSFKVFDENFNNLKPIQFVEHESTKDPVFLFPGFEGKMKFVQELIHNLKRPVYCFQYPFEKSPGNVNDIAKFTIQFLKDYARTGEKINIVAHSFGGLIALSTIKELQHTNKVHLCLTDSSPYAIKFMTSASFGDFHNRKKFENDLLFSVLNWMKISDIQQFNEAIYEPLEWDHKLKFFVEILPEHSEFSKRSLCTIINGTYRALQAVFLYDENSEKLDAKTSLIRSSERILPFPDDFHEGKYFTQPTRTIFTKGNHFNMLRYPEIADTINQELDAN